MLCPPAQLLKEDAFRWGCEIVNQEIREQACRNLFQELPYAEELVQGWTAREEDNIRTTGYWLFARLCIIRSEAVVRIGHDELIEKAVSDLKSESLLLRQSALNMLKFFGRISPYNAEKVMSMITAFEYSNDPQEKEIFDLLSFEFQE
ncbi:hypothetical protein SDC9_129604 [bioreactor metagenome]|uniref:DNA alkylation repair enzyme n=2 Tax=root TaxID=1 RepID=A0A645D0B4_9ZZZZ